MKKPEPSDGFLMCFLYYLIVHIGWGILSLVLMILHFVWNLPWILTCLSSLIWCVQALVLSGLLYWGNQSGQVRTPEKENKNPYSAKNQEIFPENQGKSTDEEKPE